MRSNKKTILVVLQHFPSLSETFVYVTIENLIRAGYIVKVVAREKGQSPHRPSFSETVRYLPTEYRNIYVKAFLVIIWAGQYCLRNSRNISGLAKIIFRYETTPANRVRLAYRILPLLLISADITYFPFGGMAAKYLEYIRFNQNTSFFSLRGSDINIDPLVNDKYRKRLKEALTIAAGVHCVCKAIERKAIELADGNKLNTRVIYTAVNEIFLPDTGIIEVTHNTGNKPTQIISAGRLDWKRGYEHGIMAINELVNRCISVEWKIYGAGNYEIPLQWAIRDLRLEDFIHILGGVDQDYLQKELKSSDIYFHPSVAEGISNSVLEAMASGLPVVACDVGGMGEVIEDGVNGRLIEARNWREMANALEELINNPQKRIEFGKKGMDTCRASFTYIQQQESFLKFIDSITSK